MRITKESIEKAKGLAVKGHLFQSDLVLALIAELESRELSIKLSDQRHAAEDKTILSSIGQVLGYPVDQDGGIATGEHTAISIVCEAVSKLSEIRRLQTEFQRLLNPEEKVRPMKLVKDTTPGGNGSTKTTYSPSRAVPTEVGGIVTEGGVTNGSVAVEVIANALGDAVESIAEDGIKAVEQLRRDDEKCPKCGGEQDTGWECLKCGFDDAAYHRGIVE